MRFFSEPTTEELQADLKALCRKIDAMGRFLFSDMDKYERLLAAIYRRGAEPAMFLVKEGQPQTNRPPPNYQRTKEIGIWKSSQKRK